MITCTNKVNVAVNCDHNQFNQIFGSLLANLEIDISIEIMQEITEYCVETCDNCRRFVRVCDGISCHKQSVVIRKCASFYKCGRYISKCGSCKYLAKICSLCDNHIYNSLCARCIQDEYTTHQYQIMSYGSDIYVKCQVKSSKYQNQKRFVKYDPYCAGEALYEYYSICQSDYICINCTYLCKCKICHAVSCSICLSSCYKCGEWVCLDCSRIDNIWIGSKGERRDIAICKECRYCYKCDEVENDFLG